MPLNTTHTVTGLLLLEKGEPVLRVDDGGTWRLLIGQRARRHLGQRVTVEGTRMRFDALYVETIRPSGGAVPPQVAWWQRLFG